MYLAPCLEIPGIAVRNNWGQVINEIIYFFHCGPVYSLNMSHSSGSNGL